jgi:hypothetical protein
VRDLPFARLITRELAEDAVIAAGRKEQRRRLLPARVTVYSVLALALFYADPYEGLAQAGALPVLAGDLQEGLGGADLLGVGPGPPAAWR